jgi:hypothetical protein
VSRSFCLALALCTAALPSDAAEFIVRDGSMVITGPINFGDHARFREALEKSDVQVGTVYLDSSGGRLEDAREIARHIRDLRLTTVVDGRTSTCWNACAVMFAAGWRRHYVNAGAVFEGAAVGIGGGGLGFQGRIRIASGAAPSSPHEAAEKAETMSLFLEFGVPNAVPLGSKARRNTVYRINGKTALDLGVATSLETPR